MSALEAETEALRHGAGAYRAPRDVLTVGGPDAETYLQGQLSQDLGSLAVGAAADSLLLEPDGKLSALVRVTRRDGGSFILDVEGGYGEAVTARLRRFLLRSKVEIETIGWRCLSLRGDAVEDAAAGLLTVLAERGVLALRFAWNGWTGVDLLGPADVVLEPQSADLPAGVVSCGADAVEACRIASGIPAMGTELTNKTIAAEAGLVERTVSFTKGCYTGQELVARIDSRGSNVARRLVGVLAPEGPPESGGPVPGHDAPRRRRAGGRRCSGRQSGGLHHVERLEPRTRRVGGPWLPASHGRCPRSCPRPIGGGRRRVEAGPRRQPPDGRRRRRALTRGVPNAARDRRRAAALVLAVAYSVLAATTTPFSWQADLVTALPIGALAVAVALRWPLRTRSGRRTASKGVRHPFAPWVVLLAAVVAWELVQYGSAGSRASHPTLSSMADAVDRYVAAQGCGLLLVVVPGCRHRARRGTVSHDRRRGRCPDRGTVSSAVTYLVWALLGVAALGLWAWSRSGRARVARASEVLARAAQGPLLRLALVLAWMWAGWHLFAR